MGIHYILSIHSSGNEYWVVSTLGLIMDNAAIKCVYKFLCEHMFSILLGLYLGVEFLGHMLTLCLII